MRDVCFEIVLTLKQRADCFSRNPKMSSCKTNKWGQSSNTQIVVISIASWHYLC